MGSSKPLFTENTAIRVRYFGLTNYGTTWHAMRSFTNARDSSTTDELWLLEHTPVFTLGQASRPEHLKNPQDIPVVHTDRGGQVTYHGPGQLVVYVLLDLNRRRIGVRRLVEILEQSVIALVSEVGIEATGKREAPGVYVQGQKLAALGLRVCKGCCYHGLSLNVNMDLEPFARIDPCGYPGLRVIQLYDLGISWTMERVASLLTKRFLTELGTEA
uniref:Octanoyltransferase n=1 Tax=Candidatus Kentrum sp. TUN TaxID=2126343 RepID=A0A450ZSD2_9GAMM|nr:MAG: lipoyl(octanoyl) transferase [Candidatus Kentron sp. TUN]VFK56016.1 MAG: lipoyl(octanoyl) transferase [Candidatus Kentron sp. TUN]VFK56694.1 MAG: lipoyl(octanoyl) transferase [Candidatus Kentron sp. TUN]